MEYFGDRLLHRGARRSSPRRARPRAKWRSRPRPTRWRQSSMSQRARDHLAARPSRGRPRRCSACGRRWRARKPRRAPPGNDTRASAARAADRGASAGNDLPRRERRAVGQRVRLVAAARRARAQHHGRHRPVVGGRVPAGDPGRAPGRPAPTLSCSTPRPWSASPSAAC